MPLCPVVGDYVKKQSWKLIFERAKSESGRYFGKVGIFGLAVTAVSYWVYYDGKIANRHESAWSR